MNQLQWYLLFTSVLMHTTCSSMEIVPYVPEETSIEPKSWGFLFLPKDPQDVIIKHCDDTSTRAISSTNKDLYKRYALCSITKQMRQFVENMGTQPIVILIDENNFPFLGLSKKTKSDAVQSLSLLPVSIVVSRSGLVGLAEINWTNPKSDRGTKFLVECTYPTKDNPMTFKRSSSENFFTSTAQYHTDDQRRMLVISQSRRYIDVGGGVVLYVTTPSLTKAVTKMEQYPFTNKPITYDSEKKQFRIPSTDGGYLLSYNTLLPETKKVWDTESQALVDHTSLGVATIIKDTTGKNSETQVKDPKKFSPLQYSLNSLRTMMGSFTGKNILSLFSSFGSTTMSAIYKTIVGPKAFASRYLDGIE
jgi:hypothetical protein